MENKIASQLSALGHRQRLAVFRLLVRRAPDRVAAGEIASALGIKPSTLSSYLSALLQADLILQEREGTWLRYRVNQSATRDIFSALFLDCCRGRPELCGIGFPEAGTGENLDPDHPLNVLFLCSGNSARSIFAEAILRDTAHGKFKAYSAGTRPRAHIHPIAAAVLKAKGHEIADLEAKGLDLFSSRPAPRMDFVFTVCDQAANEDCPTWEGHPITSHWGVADPVAATGNESEIHLAFLQVYDQLNERLRAFTALPVRTLDRLSLQRAVDDIAAHHTGNR